MLWLEELRISRFLLGKKGIRQKIVEGYNTSELGYVIVFAFVATEIRSFIYG